MTRDRPAGSGSGRSFADFVTSDPAVARIEKRDVRPAVKAPGKRRPTEARATPPATPAEARPTAPATPDEALEDAARVFRGDLPTGDFRALRSGRIRPGGRIDLHRLDRGQAQHALRKAFGTASAQGTHCMLVIHGRGRRSPLGEATLASALPGWLRCAPLDAWVRGFAPALPRDGGDGATYVWLRTPRGAREPRSRKHPR